jgi:hypothetical protein
VIDSVAKVTSYALNGTVITIFCVHAVNMLRESTGYSNRIRVLDAAPTTCTLS